MNPIDAVAGVLDMEPPPPHREETTMSIHATEDIADPPYLIGAIKYEARINTFDPPAERLERICRMLDEHDAATLKALVPVGKDA